MKIVRPTIVLLSANTGYGHTKAGLSLEQELRHRFPEWNIIHEDACNYSKMPKHFDVERIWTIFSTTPVIRTLYSIFHKAAVSKPFLFRALRWAYYGTGKRLASHFAKEDVRVVIALHPGAAAACTFWKKEKEFLLAVVATDLVVHGFQTYPEIDHIFCDARSVFTYESASSLLSSGRLSFAGLPVEKEFFETKQSSIRQAKKTVLLTFGAKGICSKKHIRRLLLAMKDIDYYQFIIVCGDSPKLQLYAKHQIEKLGLIDKSTVFGFSNEMQKLIHDADIVVGKPGGITTGEVLASNKRLVVLDYLPGQEEYNLRVILEHGLGKYVSPRNIRKELVNAIEELQSNNVCLFSQREKQGIEAISYWFSETLDTPQRSSSNLSEKITL